MTAAEIGAEVGREEGDEEGDFPEEGLQYGQAAADDCEVDFYDPVKRWPLTMWEDAKWVNRAYIQILICTISQLGSAASGEV